MRILLSNDDGVHAPGLKILQKELSKIADVWAVAPLEEKSTTGHSLTLHKPLRLIDMGDRMFGVNGSPADCVYVGIRKVLNNRMPDLVISGPNRGANLGQDVYYSGTVSAAREACILGIPSIAVSLAVNFKSFRNESQLNYLTASKFCVDVIRKMKEWVIPQYTLLNLNVPDLKPKQVKGLQITRQGFRYYSGNIISRKDHRGKDYYWVGGQYRGFKSEPGTDCYEVDRGYASITPLQLDATDAHCLRGLQSRLDSEGKSKKNKMKV